MRNLKNYINTKDWSSSTFPQYLGSFAAHCVDVYILTVRISRTCVRQMFLEVESPLMSYRLSCHKYCHIISLSHFLLCQSKTVRSADNPYSTFRFVTSIDNQHGLLAAIFTGFGKSLDSFIHGFTG